MNAENPNRGLLDTFKSCDEIIKTQKEFAKKTKLCIRLLNALGALLAITVFVATLVNTQIGDSIMLAFEIVLMLSLVFVVVHMRRTIKATKIAFPNEKLVLTHLFNFIIWIPFYMITIYDEVYVREYLK